MNDMKMLATILTGSLVVVAEAAPVIPESLSLPLSCSHSGLIFREYKC